MTTARLAEILVQCGLVDPRVIELPGFDRHNTLPRIAEAAKEIEADYIADKFTKEKQP